MQLSVNTLGEGVVSGRYGFRRLCGCGLGSAAGVELRASSHSVNSLFGMALQIKTAEPEADWAKVFLCMDQAVDLRILSYLLPPKAIFGTPTAPFRPTHLGMDEQDVSLALHQSLVQAVSSMEENIPSEDSVHILTLLAELFFMGLMRPVGSDRRQHAPGIPSGAGLRHPITIERLLPLVTGRGCILGCPTTIVQCGRNSIPTRRSASVFTTSDDLPVDFLNPDFAGIPSGCIPCSKSPCVLAAVRLQLTSTLIASKRIVPLLGLEVPASISTEAERVIGQCIDWPNDVFLTSAPIWDTIAKGITYAFGCLQLMEHCCPCPILPVSSLRSMHPGAAALACVIARDFPGLAEAAACPEEVRRLMGRGVEYAICVSTSSALFPSAVLPPAKHMYESVFGQGAGISATVRNMTTLLSARLMELPVELPGAATCLQCMTLPSTAPELKQERYVPVRPAAVSPSFSRSSALRGRRSPNSISIAELPFMLD